MSDLPVAHVARFRPRRRSMRSCLLDSLSDHAGDQAIRRSRDKLSQYDDRLLRDIGLIRGQVTGRASRPAWAVPDWWVTQTR